MNGKVKAGVAGILFSICFYSETYPQNINERPDNTDRIMFYNVENLYDPFNDSIKDDDEFTYGEIRHWNYTKYRTKLVAISRVIIAAGEGRLPMLVGLCEVENKFVMDQLVHKSPLKGGKYSYIHHESPDPRGVDVALLYDSTRFKPVYNEFITIIFPGESVSRTREILYCCGISRNIGRLHIFVNHWPSNYGGSASSDIRRKYVSGRLRSKLDSIFISGQEAGILIMGDMNEGPDGDNLKFLCKKDSINRGLVNLCTLYPMLSGTHKYKGSWEVLDHLIVSESLNKNFRLSARIFDADFLLEPDEAYTGLKPFRSFSGPSYKGGFSDHLPVLLDIKK